MDPSKPTDPQVDPSASIPRSRSSEEPSEALVGEVIPKGVPIGRRTTHTDQRGPAPAPGLYDTPLSPGRQAQEAGQPKPKGRLRRAFVVVAALAVGFCLAAPVVAFLLYHKATTPDRSSPTLTVRQYLSATFDDRDSLTAARFTCSSPSEMTEIQALLKQLQDKEHEFNIRIQVSWTRMTESIDGDSATVPAELRIAVPEANGQTSESVQHWTFGLRKSSGWKVCSAHQAV